MVKKFKGSIVLFLGNIGLCVHYHHIHHRYGTCIHAIEGNTPDFDYPLLYAICTHPLFRRYSCKIHKTINDKRKEKKNGFGMKIVEKKSQREKVKYNTGQEKKS